MPKKSVSLTHHLAARLCNCFLPEREASQNENWLSLVLAYKRGGSSNFGFNRSSRSLHKAKYPKTNNHACNHKNSRKNDVEDAPVQLPSRGAIHMADHKIKSSKRQADSSNIRYKKKKKNAPSLQPAVSRKGCPGYGRQVGHDEPGRCQLGWDPSVIIPKPEFRDL